MCHRDGVASSGSEDWVLYGFYMGFIWVLYGFYMVLYGFYMGFIYFDMGFMIVSCSVVFFGVGADRILMGSAHRRCRGTTILEQ